MKPRNERERECMSLSAKLPSITSAQRSYAIEHCFDHKACVRSTKYQTYYCLDCGATIPQDHDENQIRCPYCGHKLTIGGVRQKKKERSSFQVITTTHGWQIVRTWYIERTTHGGEEAKYELYEAVQRWMKPSQKDIIISLNRAFMARYVDQFDRYSKMSIHIENGTYYRTPYNLYAYVIYPRQSVLPILKRNGYCRWLKENTKFSDTFHKLLDHSEFETIAKVGRFDIWENFVCKEISENFIYKRWPQIKMAIRHDYYPVDYKVWEDTIDMAEECGCDIYSPKYVLPANLQQMHDRLLRRKNAAEREQEILAHYKDEGKFLKLYKMFFGVCIEEEGITIRPLQNFEEFYDEGKAMHHCVATYFGREGSLILTARQGNQRLATIELDTKNFEVRQCRSVNNSRPELYDKILNILDKHKKDFIKVKRNSL